MFNLSLFYHTGIHITTTTATATATATAAAAAALHISCYSRYPPGTLLT